MSDTGELLLNISWGDYAEFAIIEDKTNQQLIIDTGAYCEGATLYFDKENVEDVKKMIGILSRWVNFITEEATK
jgi:hypothetical protein